MFHRIHTCVKKFSLYDGRWDFVWLVLLQTQATGLRELGSPVFQL